MCDLDLGGRGAGVVLDISSYYVTICSLLFQNPEEVPDWTQNIP
jgi:hypothetical protein